MNKLTFSLAVTSIVLFILLMAVLAIGGFIYGALGLMADVLQSPAATSNITFDELVIVSESVNVTLYGFSAEFNSKIVDLILLATGQ